MEEQVKRRPDLALHIKQSKKQMLQKEKKYQAL